ncbi:MAG: ROK family protein [Anaerolineae bacterium]
MTQLLLALDFGGTKLTAGLTVAGHRYWQARRQVFSPPGADAAYDLETMISLARDLLGDTPPAAVGVSFGGPVNAAEGTVLLSHHVPGWENIPLRDRLQSALGVPVSVDNDANAGALGEWRFGAGQGCQNLLYITVSTGIGGGWILGGRVYHGADSLAGEIGHTAVQSGGPVCTCGQQRGCLEAVAAGPAIARSARERLLAEPEAGAVLRELAGGEVEAVTAKLVSQAAEAGDELAQQVLDEAARALGMGIGNAIALMNPERVVVGGGVAKAGPRYFQVVRAAAQANVLPEMRVDIVPAALGDDAPLWGAIALAEELAHGTRS